MLNTPSAVLFTASLLTLLIESISRAKIKKTEIIKGVAVCFMAVGLIFFQFKIAYLILMSLMASLMLIKGIIDNDNLTHALAVITFLATFLLGLAFGFFIIFFFFLFGFL